MKQTLGEVLWLLLHLRCYTPMITDDFCTDVRTVCEAPTTKVTRVAAIAEAKLD